ncbi:MAG: hypothetical protein JSR54_04290 [Proteobacteria bacterium]|nr:hypothetical protein [Pseudomonadota bacterium]
MNCLRAFGVALAIVSGGCAAGGDRVTEYLDQQTAVTIRALAEPLVYAHEAPQLAANARDYLSLGLVEINNMGARRHYLALVSWSTIDRALAGAPRAPIPERIALNAGERTIELSPASHEARSLGIGGALFRPPSGYVGESWYAVDPGQLRALAAAPGFTIALESDDGSTPYVPWRAEDAALTEFVRDIPDAAAPARR